MTGDFEFSDTIANWQTLIRPRAHDIRDTRSQLQWAAQVIVAFANKATGTADLEWSTPHCGLSSRANDTRLRALLRFPSATIELLDDGQDPAGASVATISLTGRRLTEVMEALGTAAAEFLGRDDFVLELPEHQLPTHRVDPDGAAEPFGDWKDYALTELTRWFANGDRALRELAKQDARATAVRYDPQQFGIVRLLAVERENGPSSTITHSIDVGIAADGGNYADAYWYVVPRPGPASPKLPALAGGGIWHRRDWVGAVLTSTALREHQATQFVDFMRSALTACAVTLRG
jgi:hypothetical protein